MLKKRGHVGLQPNQERERELIFARCTAGFDKLNISPSGEVFPCEAFKWLGGRNLRPNVFEVPLAFIWENDPLLRLVREAPIPQACLEIGCDKAEACRGGCKGQAAQHWIRDELIEFLKRENKRVYGRYFGEAAEEARG